jgi:hypothetical protein
MLGLSLTAQVLSIAISYTTQAADLNQNLAVQVTPSTIPENADLSNGTVGASPVVTLVTVIGVGNLLAPDINQRIWSDADKYRQGLGNEARLPTKDKLQRLFVDATSSAAIYPNEGYVGNAEMCSVYGRPLYGGCQGIGNGYWSSTPNSVGYHYGVGLS